MINKDLCKIYRMVKKLFPQIEKTCIKCNSCCRTYGWLLENEAKDFIEKGLPVVELNKNLFCIDSFKRNKNGKIILNEIPRCIFYKNNRCLIQSIKPLDCRLYPIKMKFKGSKVIIGISTGCKYFSSLNENGKNKLYKKIIYFFKKAPKGVIREYISLMYKVYKLSTPKKFWMKKLIEMETN